MKRLKMLCLGLMVAGIAHAQAISPEVLGSAGDRGTAGTTTVDWTIGEPLVETVAGSSDQITQGFQQPKYMLVAIDQPGNIALDVKMFPNPTSDFLHVEFTRSDEGKIVFDLIGIEGAVLLNESTEEQNGKIVFDMSNLAAGNYFLRVLPTGGHLTKTYKIQKVY